MKKYRAVLFDLDDTLLNRAEAVDNLFKVIIDKYYSLSNDADTEEMLETFRYYDKKNYGDGDKVKVLSPFFEAFPPDQYIT